MKFCILTCPGSRNIGDDIQSLAVAQHVDQEFGFISRDHLNQYQGEPVVVVMNGWFSHEPHNWPPSPAITPIFFGFHMTSETAAAYAAHRDYLKRHEPIGCRDQTTADMMISWGVQAYVSGCATMTFPRRDREPEQPRLVLVNQTRKHLTQRERLGHIYLSHVIETYLQPHTRLLIAEELLRFYRDLAGLVVSSRIHCVMPCAAMGVPVVFTGKRDGRTAIIDMIGIRTVRTRRFPRTRLKELEARPVDFEETKQRIAGDLRARLTAHGIRVRAASLASQSASSAAKTAGSFSGSM